MLLLILILQTLRMEAIKYKNQKKLEELLVQDPDIHPHYKFETTKSKSQLKKTFGIFSFLEKVICSKTATAGSDSLSDS